MSSIEETIFRSGSATYYWGSRFFPKAIRSDVFKLYSFLRLADDYVDCVPPEAQKFRALRAAWQQAMENVQFDAVPAPSDTIDQRIIKNIVAVSGKYNFERRWVEAFWNSMQADLAGKAYKTLQDSLWYTYGSAEAVGLMMAKIMGAPPGAYSAAKLQGRAMQWINFIRDVEEDNQLGRCYFPREDLQKFGLKNLEKETAHTHPEAFQQFMRYEIERYRAWQSEAAKGQRFIPGVLRPALRTAADMYGWTADKIERDPLIVFAYKVKPRKSLIVRRGLHHLGNK